jgi:acetyl esterase/lipase
MNRSTKVKVFFFVLYIIAISFQNGLSQINPLQNQMFLWSSATPGSENVKLEEKIIERSQSSDIFDRAVNGITKPSIIPMFPPKDKVNGTAVLICPGGAYQRIVLDKEGIDIGNWLNSIGVTVFILKYRLPGEGHIHQSNVPLQDAQRAMRIIRKNAAQWNLNAHKIGVAGFSAGGHVAATLATKYATAVYKGSDDADKLDARPDFVILGYPVISMKDNITHKVSREMLLGKNPAADMINMYSAELHVNAQTPPSFIFLANDDSSVSPENSKMFYEGLKKFSSKSELRIFEANGHGFGIRGATSAAAWPKFCEEWLTASGMISKK